MLNEIVQSPECSLILNKLKTELPSYLHYHTFYHTMDVCKRAEAIAFGEGICDADIRLLLVAATYHDAGYLQSSSNHEILSCNIAKDVLPGYKYSDKELNTICALIMATEIPQTPHSLLEQIICDADLDYLGRDDFDTISKLLYQEMLERGIIENEDTWNHLQINFLENHHYFTATAIRERQAQKEKHLFALKHKIMKL